MLKNLQFSNTTSTGNRKPVYSRPYVTIETEKSGKIEPSKFVYSEEYIMTLSVKVSFWANPAQYDMAHRQAEKVLASNLYGDLLTSIVQLRSSIFNDEKAEALTILNQLEVDLLSSIFDK